MCSKQGCKCLTNSFYQSILDGKGRSITFESENSIKCEENLVTKTVLNDNTCYASLTMEGLSDLILRKGRTPSETEYIVGKVKKIEEKLYKEVLGFLRAHKTIGTKVTHIRLLDNTVIASQENVEDFRLPLRDTLLFITSMGYKPINLRSKIRQTNIENTNLSDFVFLNQRMDGILTIYIDVTEGA
ncbi:hypothetical protein P9X10_02400 [Bacillus cereus]|nr:hypothetical protein [Bacillus cereus]